MTTTDDPPRPRPGSAGPAGTVADAPPVRLPALHFAAATVFFVLGAAALVWSAPALAAGSFSDPGVIGAFHLLTLGWISTSIMGTSQQLLPVVLGARLRWEGLGYVSFAAWTAGTAAFAGGTLGRWPTAYLAGAGALGGGALLFVVNLWASLGRGPRRDLTWWSLGAAGLFLLAGWILGFLLAVNLTTGLLGTTRYSVLAVHVHLAAGGWVLLTMIGVGQRLLPHFLGSRGVTPLPGRAAAGLTGFGALLLLASEHLLPAGVVRAGLWSLAAGALAFVLQGALHYRARSRGPGMAMGLAGGGLLCLGLAAVAGAVLLLAGSPDAGMATAYGLLLVPGAMALFFAGFQDRIVHFLARLHGLSAPEREPGVSHPGSGSWIRRQGTVAAGLLGGGALGLAGGSLGGHGALTVGAAAAYGAGAVLLAARTLPLSVRLSAGVPGRSGEISP